MCTITAISSIYIYYIYCTRHYVIHCDLVLHFIKPRIHGQQISYQNYYQYLRHVIKFSSAQFTCTGHQQIREMHIVKCPCTLYTSDNFINLYEVKFTMSMVSQVQDCAPRASVALMSSNVYFETHDVIIFIIYSTWPLYFNVCIVTTLTAKSVGRLNIHYFEHCTI